MINDSKNKYIYYILFFLPLFLFSAYRNGLGTDYYAYAYAYSHPDNWQGEILFKILFITLPRLLSQNEIFFFLITSFIISFFFLKTILNYSQIILLSILIYVTQFYFTSYNAVRQYIAIALFLYFAIKFLNEKRYILYCILIILLAQIHFSLYFMLLFPFLGVFNHRMKIYWIIWLTSFILFIFQSYNIINFSTLFSFVPKLVFLSDKFGSVLEGGDYFFNLYKSNNQLIVKNLFCFAFLYRLKYYKADNTIYWFNLFLFGVIAHNILVKFSIFAVRIAYIGDVALLMLVPLFINSFKVKKYRIALILFFVLYFSYTFYYRFVLGGESDVFREGIWVGK